MIEEFLDLFQGNPNVIGMDDAGFGKPGPMHLGGSPERKRAAWHIATMHHLRGDMGIGVYPYNHEFGAVRWGCVDLDDGATAWDQAVLLRDVLHAYGITAFVERSRSKGYHVWIFATTWCPAHVMRRALLGACQTAGVPFTEVNPKSESLEADQLGNFVRLPYKGGILSPPQRQVVVDLAEVPIALPLFLRMGSGAAAPVHEIYALMEQLYAEPPPPRRVHHDGLDGPWLERLNGLAVKQLEEGPKLGSDRSSYLYAFGQACAESGLDEDEITQAVRLADERHCDKYSPRRDGPTRYADIARKALATSRDNEG